MNLSCEAMKLIAGLQAHNGKGICVMERLGVAAAISEMDKREAECAMRHECLAADGENFCSSCGMDLAAVKVEVEADEAGRS